MHIERDAAGRVHISDEGVLAVVDEAFGILTYTITGVASYSAITRVNELVADASAWPTLRLPRLDLAHDQVEMIELLE